MAKILKGADVVASMNKKLSVRVKRLQENGVQPTLALIRLGENRNDISCEQSTYKKCQLAGVSLCIFSLPEDCTQERLESIIKQINENSRIHGCFILRPLPKQIDEKRICELLIPEKDVDCITKDSLHGVFTGEKVGFLPCRAEACLETMNYYGIDPNGKRVTTVGPNTSFVEALAVMMTRNNAIVKMCHSETLDISEECKDAEILIIASEQAETIGARYVSNNQIVIDTGVNVDNDGHLHGDIIFQEVEPVVKAVTPAPGGIGTVMSTVLVKHVVEAAEKVLETR